VTPRLSRLSAGLLTLSALVLPLTAATLSTADAAVQAKHYKSCAALQKDYPHGVGKKGAKDKTSGTKVTTFKVSNKVYGMNDGPRNKATGEYDLDRDNDGIACEKR
jgi:uncharacterized membrane protein